MPDFIVNGIATVKVKANNQGEAKIKAEQAFSDWDFRAIQAHKMGGAMLETETSTRDVGASGQDRAGTD